MTFGLKIVCCYKIRLFPAAHVQMFLIRGGGITYMVLKDFPYSSYNPFYFSVILKREDQWIPEISDVVELSQFHNKTINLILQDILHENQAKMKNAKDQCTMGDKTGKSVYSFCLFTKISHILRFLRRWRRRRRWIYHDESVVAFTKTYVDNIPPVFRKLSWDLWNVAFRKLTKLLRRLSTTC